MVLMMGMMMMRIMRMMRMYLLKTKVKAVCALGRDFDKGKILFKQILLLRPIRYTTEILYIPFVHSTILIAILLMVFHNHTHKVHMTLVKNTICKSAPEQHRQQSPQEDLCHPAFGFDALLLPVGELSWPDQT